MEETEIIRYENGQTHHILSKTLSIGQRRLSLNKKNQTNLVFIVFL